MMVNVYYRLVVYDVSGVICGYNGGDGIWLVIMTQLKRETIMKTGYVRLSAILQHLNFSMQ